MGRHGIGRIVLVSLLLATLSLVPQTALAARFLGTDAPGLPAGERIDDDLYLIGNVAAVDGEVRRTLLALAQSLTVAGPIGGDLNAIAATVTVTGPVGGTARLIGQTVTIDGSVGWDVIGIGSTVSIPAGGRVGHDLILLTGGTVTVDGTVGGRLLGIVDTLVISGRVDGDVQVEAQRVEIRDGAQLGGALRYSSPQPATIAPGARIAGPVEFTQRERPTETQPTPAQRALDWVTTVLLRLGWALVAGTLLVLALPRQTVRTAEALRRAPLWTLLWGFVLLIAVPIGSILLAVTVVGLPAALLLLGLSVAVLYLSQVFLGIAVVRLLPVSVFRSDRRLHLWLAMLLGTTAVLLFRMLPIPFGWTIWWSVLVGMLGLGMAWVAFTGLGMPRPAPAGPSAGATSTPPSEPATSPPVVPPTPTAPSASAPPDGGGAAAPSDPTSASSEQSGTVDTMPQSGPAEERR